MNQQNSNLYIHSEDVHNVKAPSVILPEVLRILKIHSVLDLGCGIGTWLSVAKGLGISDVLGVDGDYVDKTLLSKYLTEKEFLVHDLTLPLALSRKFDLCLCLEVAEHLPESAAYTLIETLVHHSDAILFSAAIPGQGGQNHLNEQKPEYWQNIFKEYNYKFIDCIRPLIWNDTQVDFWYKQNTFLVVKESFDLNFPLYNNLLFNIHPDLLIQKNLQLMDLNKKLDHILQSKKSPWFYLSLLKKSLIRFFKKWSL